MDDLVNEIMGYLVTWIVLSIAFGPFIAAFAGYNRTDNSEYEA